MAKKKISEQRINVPILEALFMTDDVNEFYKLIAYDISFWVYRNPIADEWRQIRQDRFLQYLNIPHNLFEGVIGKVFSEDVFSLERQLIVHLERWYPLTLDRQGIENLSVKEMCDIVNGVEWTELYRQFMHWEHVEPYLGKRWLELRAEHSLPDLSHKFY